MPIFRKEKKFYGHGLFIFVRPLLARGFEHAEPFHVKVICVTQINPTGKKLEEFWEIAADSEITREKSAIDMGCLCLYVHCLREDTHKVKIIYGTQINSASEYSI